MAGKDYYSILGVKKDAKNLKSRRLIGSWRGNITRTLIQVTSRLKINSNPYLKPMKRCQTQQKEKVMMSSEKKA